MINAERDYIATEPDEPLRKQGFTEVYSVSGDFDLTVVRVKDTGDLAKIATQDHERSRIIQSQDIGRVRTLQQL